MKRVRSLFAIALISWPTSVLLGHGVPIQLQAIDGQLQVSGGLLDPAGFAPMLFVNPGEDAQLERITLPTLGDVALTNLPGFDLNSVSPGSGLELALIPRPVQGTAPVEERLLWFWNPADQQVAVAGHDESLLIASEFGDLQIFQADTDGTATLKIATPLANELNVHNHYLRYILDDNPRASLGVYGFFAQLTSPVYRASEPFLVVFNNGVGDDAMLTDAALAINAAAHLPGDFNADGFLTTTDLDLLSAEIAGGGAALQFDIDHDSTVNVNDLNHWVTGLKHSWIGDVDLDGTFGSSDLVIVFQAGLYETEGAASWSTGDWNADLRFNSADVVAAFQAGGYEQGPRASHPVHAVPEPLGTAALGMAMILGAKRSFRPSKKKASS